MTTTQMTPAMDPDTFVTALGAYIAKAEATAKSLYSGAHANEYLTIVPARRFVHIVWKSRINGGRSAFVSVEKSTGNVHRSEGWGRAGRLIGSIKEAA